ncbi:MAG: hypothetical protein FJW20_05915 [Acidimicrobiia bacterium]|nr:hypothetical protein [Acidimicrobiia bacterium]
MTIPAFDVAKLLAVYLLLTWAIVRIGLGAQRVLRLGGVEMARGERWAVGWVLGAAVFSHLMFAIAAMGLLDTWPFVVVAGALLIPAGRGSRREAAPWGVGGVIGAVFLAVILVAAMAPSDDSDGYRYHLGLPHLYLNAGRMFPMPEDFYSAFPQGMEMLYLAGLKLEGFAAANLMHWNFLAALTLMMRATAGREGMIGAAAVCAASVVATTTASASVELGLAAALWLVFHACQRWREEGAAGWLVAAAVAAGFACSVKYTGVIAVVLLVVMVGRWKPAAIAAAVAGLWAAPWLVRNWMWFSNPVYPFLNAWFENPHLLPSSEVAWIANIRNYGGAKFDWSYPWEATIRGVKTMGFAGPFFLLSPLALAARNRMLVAAGIVALPWILGVPILRFGIPMMPFLAVAVAAGISRLLSGRAAGYALAVAVIVQGVMCFPPVIEKWNKQWVIALKEIPWRGALRLESPEGYWKRKIRTYEALRWAEAKVSKEARILALDEQYQFFTTRRMAAPYTSEYGLEAREALLRAADPGLWPTVRCQAVFGERTVRKAGLRQKISNQNRRWTVYEVTASTTKVTEWSSREPMQAGMSIEMEMPPGTKLDRMEWLTSVYEGGEIEVELDGDPVEAAVTCRGEEALDFRLRTTRMLRRRGWTHILAAERHEWLEEAMKEAEKWGLRTVYEKNGVRLIEVGAGT